LSPNPSAFPFTNGGVLLNNNYLVELNNFPELIEKIYDDAEGLKEA
jgi:hypothetical protein